MTEIDDYVVEESHAGTLEGYPLIVKDPEKYRFKGYVHQGDDSENSRMWFVVTEPGYDNLFVEDSEGNERDATENEIDIFISQIEDDPRLHYDIDFLKKIAQRIKYERKLFLKLDHEGIRQYRIRLGNVAESLCNHEADPKDLLTKPSDVIDINTRAYKRLVADIGRKHARDNESREALETAFHVLDKQLDKELEQGKA